MGLRVMVGGMTGSISMMRTPVILNILAYHIFLSPSPVGFIFIALEISSIATYILAAIRKHSGKSPEAGLKYFLLGSFATAFFLYGIALTFGATGTTNIADVAAALVHSPTPGFATLGARAGLAVTGFAANGLAVTGAATLTTFSGIAAAGRPG